MFDEVGRKSRTTRRDAEDAVDDSRVIRRWHGSGGTCDSMICSTQKLDLIVSIRREWANFVGDLNGIPRRASGRTTLDSWAHRIHGGK